MEPKIGNHYLLPDGYCPSTAKPRPWRKAQVIGHTDNGLIRLRYCDTDIEVIAPVSAIEDQDPIKETC